LSKRQRSAALAAAAALLAAGAALAVIPTSAKVERAIADHNRADGRNGPLLLDVRLQIAGGGPTAKGTLATHPTGLARLELESGMGFSERHLLRGTEYRASRNGQPIEDPHPFLPPLFLLQASSGEALGAALSSLGMADHEIVLGRIGDLDCYVIGGRRFPSDPNASPANEPLLPSLWVDMRSYDPVRMVGADGTEYRLSEVSSFKGIRFPRVIDIDPPGPMRARLEVVGVTQAEAPAAAFQTEWLNGSAAGVDVGGP
jgi:hypothetical protein